MTQPKNVSVDPGAIREFARFLDSQTAGLERIQQRMSDRRDTPPDFGEHPGAAAAERQHQHAVKSATTSSRRLLERHEELVLGTEELAKQYADLSELNTARSSDVTEIMEQGAQGA